MLHALPDLPWPRDALAPDISAETLEYHYGKHHQAYVNNLNKMIEGTDYADAPLEAIIRSATGGLFNNAAQVWNHSFYWNCLSPDGGGDPSGAVADAIAGAFGSFADFRSRFTQTAVGTFGSGWAWLVREEGGGLALMSTSNAGNPLTDGKTPLLTCDVWEHAYYVDYRNARAKYVEAFWRRVNWRFVESNLGG